MSPTKGEGNILFLVWNQLVSASLAQGLEIEKYAFHKQFP